MRPASPLVVAAAILAAGPCLAQTAPVNGIRQAEVRTHAITGATVVVSPVETLEHATIIIRDGVIEAVGPTVLVPANARIHLGEGLTVYAGLIDAAVLVDITVATDGAGAHFCTRVHPQVAMSELPGPDAKLRESLRKLGFTTAAVYPSKGLFRGSATVIALADEDEHVLAYANRGPMGVGFDTGGRGDREYPRSLMGAIAILRQTLYDTQWYDVCLRIWKEDPQGHEPPLRADALAALADVMLGRQPVLFDVSDEHNAVRAARILDEFELAGGLLGSGLEFRRLDEVVATERPIIIPLNYPDRPSVASLLEADDVSLRTMMTWEQAPTNARRLVDAGATIAITTHRLDKRKDFPAALAKAIQYGLDENDALAALTTTPARMLGLEPVMGTIEVGKVANLVVVEGSLFDKKPKIRDTWVNGRRHEISREPEVSFVGEGTLTTSIGLEVIVDVDTKKKKVSARLPETAPDDTADDTDADPESDAESDAKIEAKTEAAPEPDAGKGHAKSRKPKATKATNVTVLRDRVSFVLDGELFDTDGFVRMTGVVSGEQIVGNGELPDGTGFSFTVVASGETDDAAADAEATEETAAQDDAGEDELAADDESDFVSPPEQLVMPLGAYGLADPPRQQDLVVTNATIWTGGVEGIIDQGTMYVRDGRIAWIGSGARFPGAPDGVPVIDLAGRHMTPGLIDCHSHTAISGGVNEMGQANTAEVRIADVINPDDVNIYRQLAGGLTAANQLHGSANPIGGQNSVVKLKWAGSDQDMLFDDAIGGIKFALGENVKRSPQRYPNTRMGVETSIRDAFTAAVDYQRAWNRYLELPRAERARTMPPRRDLELAALVEILEGERLVHCHSYRQDEILMLVRLADDFEFTIGTFQHVLEGYKVAEAIAEHGAGASTFSDWWAYKVEVMDAIPFNGTLMHDVGVVVSFNSDSSELARRMNTEAAKAVRYGGLDPHEALKFVTLNPALQLRIDDTVGSLEPGKDADFVIWSDNPLSTYARCEQTWIEGARYFDLETDRTLRDHVATERHRLIQKILADADSKPSKGGSMDNDKDKDAKGTRPSNDDAPYSCCWSHRP